MTVVANDEVHTGRDVHKTHTTSVQTFVSAGQGTMGKVYHGLGLLDQARPFLERTLTDRRGLLGEEHPDTLAPAADRR